MSTAESAPRYSLPWRGLVQHLLITLRLNFRSRMPLIYGYVVPVFFLLAFGSVFRSGNPPLLREMGQILTITILGGTCFGLPTAFVSERDRGVWRQYRLLPSSSHALVFSACVGRALLVGSAAAGQVALAWCLYRTPGPHFPAQFLVAFGAVCFAFLGLGLVIAMLADNVPSVQAIGQCVFLPLIMIGGVGVPLRALPGWAQRVAAFLPGRYAVEALDACILPGGRGLAGASFALAALVVIGLAAFAAGFGLFRWDLGPRPLHRQAKGWLAFAFAAWILVGGVAVARQERASRTVAPPRDPPAEKFGIAEPWQKLTSMDLAAIHFDGLPPDTGLVAPLATGVEALDAEDGARIRTIAEALRRWPPGIVGGLEQRARNLLSVCAIADLSEDPNEGEIAFVVFGRLRDLAAAPALAQILGWIILHPDEGAVISEVPELGLQSAVDESAVRERCTMYAKKLLLRLPTQR